jgi:FkbH-like protein/FkbM family methyltransferase
MAYLGDHAVQDAVLLPGAFYVATALRLQREFFGGSPARVRNAVFHAPVVLSAEDTRLEVEARPREDGVTEYVFREGEGQAATLEIEPGAAASQDTFSVDDFRAVPRETLESGAYYAQLRARGNQYGPGFQGVSALWRAGEEVLARIEAPPAGAAHGPVARQAILLDCLVQTLASFALEQGGTFLLRSIASVEGRLEDAGASLWARARLEPASASEGTDYLGEVEAFDAAGRRVLKLSGVAFSLSGRGAAANLVVAANFTAEPLEESLAFWGEHFGLRLRVGFAPYNQVFQQLLDPASALGRNRDGVNAVLLALEEWAAHARTLPAISRARADECFGTRSRTVLPNGLEIAQLNPQETGYLYEEIFADECYLRHGIVLEEGDTVLDIGANVGLFSLFVQSRCPGARIYAFEPAPPAFDVLRANLAAHAPGAQAFNAGVSDKAGTATLTVYGKASVFSGFHPEEQDDRASLQAVVSNMLRREAKDGEALEEYAGELVADRLERTEYACPMVSVSEFMREHRLERIGLLKIDAEKSEAAILAGIGEEDWAKIDQLVIEVHDRAGGAAERVLERLRSLGYRCTLEEVPLLERSGLCNIYATRRAAREAGAGDSSRANLQRNVAEFCSALRAHMQRAPAPLVLCVCPRNAPDPVLDEAERRLLEEAGAIPNVQTISSSSIAQRYPTRVFHDTAAARAGHVPYTPEGYAALGTALMRAAYGLKRRPCKVIALDCDNTLWQGVCGEDGVAGIGLGAARRRLQEFMLAQMQAGMLLCLCSKNNERDVLEVFERRSEMPLKLAHFAARRLNWQGKAQNLRSLAAELGLGLDSFIFLDDDARECAEVRRLCPEVLTLQLPKDEHALGAFLDHVWAFDRAAATQEDRRRTRMVQENAQRRQFRAEASTLKDFIDGLELRVDIAPAAPAELARIAQLIARTNQFSLVTRRRSEGELRQFLAQPGAGAIAVRVADRFGDYGLVGAALFERAGGRLCVDSLLLSCRALGRGVEHAMAAWLGRQALAEGCREVGLEYRPTERNRPAQDFIAAIGGPRPGDAQTRWSLPAEQLAKLAYAPAELPPLETEAERAPQAAAESAWDFRSGSERLQAIATELAGADPVVRAIEARALAPLAQPAPTQLAEAGSLEAALADIWARVLGRARVGLNDNFFDAGGTSLKAVRVVALVKKELGRALQVVSLLECPTVALLAARLEARPTAPGAGPGEAARRGQRRRQHQTGMRAA